LKPRRSVLGLRFIRSEMEIYLTPELQARFDQLVSESGCAAEKLIEDALAGYIPELAQTREILDSRYDDFQSGRIEPVDGEAFFDSLRQRE
jgi:hypothetical protein